MLAFLITFLPIISFILWVYYKDKYNKIIDSDLVDKVLDEGRKKTMDIASSKILAVYSKMGLGRY